MIKIIPAIDILDGKLVRLFQGDYQQKTTYDESPKDMALYYQSIGFNHIHVVDLNGATDGDLSNLESIKGILGVDGITIQVGGGIRSLDHAKQLIDLGVTYIIIGSILIQEFELAKQIIAEFPNQVIAGLDVNDRMLSTNGWTKTSSVSIQDILTKLNDCPLQSIVSTDISRDGSFQGVNQALYQELSSLTQHSIIASGGVNSIQNIIDLNALHIPNLIGCIVGKAIIEGKISIEDLSLL